jgi:hypothetical protein
MIHEPMCPPPCPEISQPKLSTNFYPSYNTLLQPLARLVTSQINAVRQKDGKGEGEIFGDGSSKRVERVITIQMKSLMVWALRERMQKKVALLMKPELSVHDLKNRLNLLGVWKGEVISERAS